MPQPTNPYARSVARESVSVPQQERENGGSQSESMGPQSQRRLTFSERTHQMQSNHKKKKQKTTGQQTLFGGLAFDPLVDCEVCKAKKYGRSVHRAHHTLCNNKRGGATKSAATMALAQEEKRLQVLFTTPLTEEEKCSGRFLTKEAVTGFFEPREPRGTSVATTTISQTTTEITSTISNTMSSNVTADELCTSVTEILQDSNFVDSHTSSRAPLPMLALAKVVVDKIIRAKDINTNDYFNGVTMTVPAVRASRSSPHQVLLRTKSCWVKR